MSNCNYNSGDYMITKHYLPRMLIAEDDTKKLYVEVDIWKSRLSYVIEQDGLETTYWGENFRFVLDVFNNI